MAFDPQAFINSGSAPTQLPDTSPTENPAPAPPPVSSNRASFDPKRFINGGKASDSLTGQDIPLAYSGNTADTAMNKNALSATDKMNMAFGTKQGNIDYLKEKFPDAKEMTGPDGKPTGELAYKQGNTWFRVDPNTGDTSDPWKKTKEYVDQATAFKNIAAKTPTALGALAAGVSAFATEGMSLPASAAIAGATSAVVKTSLGRMIGTYEATPVEQAWDIGLETMLNAAGGKILAGVKPTASFMADKLGLLKDAFEDTVEPMLPAFVKGAGSAVSDAGAALINTPNAIFKKVFSGFSVGENNFDTMVENTPAVKATMNRLQGMSGGDVQAYHDQAIRDQVGTIGDIASGARDTLTQIYGNMRNKILAKVPASFSANLEDPVYNAYQSAIQKGIGALQVGGKELTGKEAMDYIGQNGMKNASFRLFNQDEMSTMLQQGAPLDKGLGYLSVDKDAHGILSDFYEGLARFTGGADRTGVQGAKDLLDFKKVASDLARKAVNSEGAQGIFEVRSLINSAKSEMDNSVYQSLKAAGVGDDFTNLNATYDKLATGFAPLLNAQKQAIASGNTKAYEGLLSSFLSRPKASASARFAIDDAIQAADSQGLTGLRDQLTGQKLDLQVTEAAKAFNPIKSGVLKAADVSGAGMGMYALASHNPALLAALAGVKAVSSPGVAKIAAQATTQGLWAGKEALSSLTAKGAEEFMSNPAAVQSFVNGVVQAPLARMQAAQQNQQVLDQLQQTQQQRQQMQQQQMNQQTPHNRYGR